MKKKKIFLIRHAAYLPNQINPKLSEKGLEQAFDLAKKIKANITYSDKNIVIWSSPTNRTLETSEIIAKELEVSVDNFIIHKELSTDNSQHPNFIWLKEQIDNFEGENLIIVTHAEYVKTFPIILNFPYNNSNYAQGVIIHDDEYTILR